MEQAPEASKKLNVLHESSDVSVRHVWRATPENASAKAPRAGLILVGEREMPG